MDLSVGIPFSPWQAPQTWAFSSMDWAAAGRAIIVARAADARTRMREALPFRRNRLSSFSSTHFRRQTGTTSPDIALAAIIRVSWVAEGCLQTKEAGPAA